MTQYIITYESYDFVEAESEEEARELFYREHTKDDEITDISE